MSHIWSPLITAEVHDNEHLPSLGQMSCPCGNKRPKQRQRAEPLPRSIFQRSSAVYQSLGTARGTVRGRLAHEQNTHRREKSIVGGTEDFS